jgi:hypothetical protein
VHRRPVLRRGVTATLLALLVLPLSGCYEADVDATIDHDSETVSGTIILGAQAKYAKDALGIKDPKQIIEGASVEAIVTSLLPGSTEVEPYEDDKVMGAKVTFTDHPLDKMPLKIPGMTFNVEHEGDTYVLDATLDPTKTPGGEAAYTKTSHASFSFTFPGDVTKTNGEVDGQTVTWEHSGSDPLTMSATSTEKASLVAAAKRNLWAPAIGLAALLGLGLAGFALRRDAARKKAAMPKAAGKKGMRGTTDTHVPPPKFATSAPTTKTTATTGPNKPKGA